MAEGESRRTQIEKYELHFEALRVRHSCLPSHLSARDPCSDPAVAQRCTKMSNIADMVKLFAEREDAKLRKMKLVQVCVCVRIV